MRETDYNTKETESEAGLVEWTFTSKAHCETLVIPDGCRDIIVKEHFKGGATCFISDLSDNSYLVSSQPGISFRGIRLQPGVQIQTHQLNLWLSNNDLETLFELDQLDEFCIKSDDISDALECLAGGNRSVLNAAQALGVSIRSLQRLVKSYTGKSPSFWFSLARARKAARSLNHYESLSEAAFEYGFSDQAHMSREMRRWFQRTPNQIKSDKEILGLLSESGYGLLPNGCADLNKKPVWL